MPERPRYAPGVVRRDFVNCAPLFAKKDVTVDEIADLLPWIMEGSRKALETQDMNGHGKWYAQQLARAAALIEQHCVAWEKERDATVPTFKE